MPDSNYSITKHDYAQLIELKRITEEAEKRNIKVSVFGGYGFDGLVGWLTRAHSDFDLIVRKEQREDFKLLLEELGYKFDSETTNKEIFLHEKLIDFRAELTKSEKVDEFLKIGENEIFPEIPNAKLYDFTFYTPSVKGHEHIHEVFENKPGQKSPARKTHDEGRMLLLNYFTRRKSK